MREIILRVMAGRIPLFLVFAAILLISTGAAHAYPNQLLITGIATWN